MKQITAVAMVSPSQATLRRATPWNGKALPSKHPNINKIPRRASRRSAELICEADGKFQPSVYIDHLSCLSGGKNIGFHMEIESSAGRQCSSRNRADHCILLTKVQGNENEDMPNVTEKPVGCIVAL